MSVACDISRHFAHVTPRPPHRVGVLGTKQKEMLKLEADASPYSSSVDLVQHEYITRAGGSAQDTSYVRRVLTDCVRRAYILL